MEWFNEAFRVVGLPPSLFATAIALGIMLRFARGMVRGFTFSHTYLCAVVAGLAAGIWDGIKNGAPNGAPTIGLAVMASALIVQFGLQKLANKVPWLPRDNEWANGGSKSPPPTNGGIDAKP